MGISPINGNLLSKNGAVHNLADMLGGGTPVEDQRYDMSQYSPRSGLILGSDGSVYDLITLVQTALSAVPALSARAVVAENAIKLNGRGVFFVSDSEWTELVSGGQMDENALYIKIPDEYLESASE